MGLEEGEHHDVMMTVAVSSQPSSRPGNFVNTACSCQQTHDMPVVPCRLKRQFRALWRATTAGTQPSSPQTLTKTSSIASW